MRTLMLIGLAGLTLAAGVPDAQARARIGHAPGPVLKGHPAKPEIVPALAVGRTGTDGAAPTYVVLPPSGSAPGLPGQASATDVPKPAAAAAAVPAKAVAEAAPWCRSGRVVGTGTGFCLIN